VQVFWNCSTSTVCFRRKMKSRSSANLFI
jgi:hypothetical protein